MCQLGSERHIISGRLLGGESRALTTPITQALQKLGRSSPGVETPDRELAITLGFEITDCPWALRLAGTSPNFNLENMLKYRRGGLQLVITNHKFSDF